jgi:hypothetical protein
MASRWPICTIIALPPPNVQRSIMDCSELTCRIIAQAIRNSCAHRIARSRRKRIRLARIRGKRLRCGDELRVRDTVDLGKGNLKLNIAKNDDMGPHAALAAFGSSRQWTSSCVQLFTVRRIYSRQNQDRVAHLLRCSLPGPIYAGKGLFAPLQPIWGRRSRSNPSRARAVDGAALLHKLTKSPP